MRWDEWEMRLERQNDEKRRDKIRKYIKWDQKIKWYETGKEEMKRWDLEEEKMRPERQAVIKTLEKCQGEKIRDEYRQVKWGEAEKKRLGEM